MRRILVFCCWMIVLASASADAFDFSLPDIDGKVHSLETYRGKWVIVNFWATDCPPCLKEIPELSAFHARHRNVDAVVLGVNFEDIKESWLREFIRSVNLNYPVLPWGTNPVTPFGEIMMLPTTFIISPTGELVGQQRGAISAEMLDRYLKSQMGHVQHTTRNESSLIGAP